VETFSPHLEILPPPQRALWDELHATPDHFTLYGGTAIALHLGHRDSVDFDFFSRVPIVADDLMRSIPYLKDAELLSASTNSLTCVVDRDGEVKLQFFGGLPLGAIEQRLQPTGGGFWVAPLLDLAATKVKVLPERSEAKDYLDIDALLTYGIDIPKMLAAAKVIYGPRFNALLSLKALTHFDDVPRLPRDVRDRLMKASLSIDPERLPELREIQAAFAKENIP
jgi:hypothetical protein